MRTEIRYEDGGWPQAVVREYAKNKRIAEVLESLIKEELLPKEGTFVCVMTDGRTEEELASYYPMMRKIVRITSRETLGDLFEGKQASLVIRKVETMAERLETILPLTTKAERKEERTSKGLLGFGKLPVPEMQESEAEEEKKPLNPYDQEKMLCEIGMSVEGTDGGAQAGSMVQLWLYLLGFVLVAAFMVRSLVAMVGGPGALNFGQMVLRNGLYFMLPAVLCFVIGKVVEAAAGKKKKDQENHQGEKNQE